MEWTKVRKIEKPSTPFGSRRTAIETFDRLFHLYCDSTIVLSYSSNGYTNLDVLTALMRRHKGSITVHERDIDVISGLMPASSARRSRNTSS